MNENVPGDRGLPDDPHLQQDIGATAADAPGADDDAAKHLTPGQTNAGQQVSGLASATGYGDADNPDIAEDGNNPI